MKGFIRHRPPRLVLRWAGLSLGLAALIAPLALASGCNKPRSARRLTTAGDATTSRKGHEAPPTEAPISRGGATLPADTPADVLKHILALPTSPGAHTRRIVALGAPAAPAMAALALSDNIAEAKAAMRYFEVTGLKLGGPAAATLAAHEVPSLRQQALLALTAIGDPAHAAAVQSVLANAPEPTTRSLAIRALAAFGTKGSAQILLASLDDLSEQVTVEVAAALATIGDTSPTILTALRDKATSPTPATALGALTALRLMGPKASVPQALVAGAMTHPDLRVVYAGIRLFSRLQGEGAATEKAALIQKALSDVRPEVRRVALGVLPKLGLNNSLERAHKLVTDPTNVVASAAVAAMDALVPPADRITTFLPLLAHPIASVRQEAVLALAKAGAKSSKPLLARLALERDSMARAFLARAMGQLKITAAIDPLIGLLDERDAGTTAKAQALQSLQALTGQEIGLSGPRWRKWYTAQQKGG